MVRKLLIMLPALFWTCAVQTINSFGGEDRGDAEVTRLIHGTRNGLRIESLEGNGPQSDRIRALDTARNFAESDVDPLRTIRVRIEDQLFPELSVDEAFAFLFADIPVWSVDSSTFATDPKILVRDSVHVSVWVLVEPAESRLVAFVTNPRETANRSDDAGDFMKRVGGTLHRSNTNTMTLMKILELCWHSPLVMKSTYGVAPELTARFGEYVWGSNPDFAFPACMISKDYRQFGIAGRTFGRGMYRRLHYFVNMDSARWVCSMPTQ